MQFSLLLLEEAADRIEALENALQNLARAVQFKVSATLAPEQDK
jgi:hypothetical protein